MKFILLVDFFLFKNIFHRMKIIYYILGMVASINEWLSRKSINFIQLNWLLIAMLGFLFYFSLQNVYESLVVSQTPEKIKISEVNSSYLQNKRYVTVSGTYIYSMAIEYGTKKKGSDELNVNTLYIPLLDKSEAKAIYIKDHVEIDFAKKPPIEKEVTGMIELLPLVVTNEISKNKEEKDIANETYTINPNSKPLKLSASLFVMFLMGLPAFAFFYTWIRRYRIIQFNTDKNFTSKDAGLDRFSSFDSRPNEIDAAKSSFVDGDFTGRLYFEKGGDRNFFMVPIRINFLEDGSVLCASNIDASSTFFGITTSDKLGIWSTLLRKGEIAKLENIYQYSGFKRKKGVLVKTIVGHESGDFLLSLNNDKDHRTVFSNLEKLF
jgi:hypothetical protein